MSQAYINLPDFPRSSRAGTVSLRKMAMPALILLVCVLAAFGLAYASFNNILVALGPIYAVAYMVVAWKRPDIAMMLIFILSPFQNNLGGGADGGDKSAHFSIVEVNIALTLPVLVAKCLLQRKWLTLGPLNLPIGLHFAVCAVVGLANWHDDDDMNRAVIMSMLQMAIYLIGTVMIFSLLPRKIGDLTLSLDAFSFVGVGFALFGWFLHLNKNGLGSSLAAAVVVTAELWFGASTVQRKQWLGLALAVTMAALILSLSRGSWLFAIVGLIVIASLRRRFDLLLRGALLMLPVILVTWGLLTPQQKDYALGFSADHYSINARLEALKLAQYFWHKSPIYGVGTDLRKEYDATNIFWLTMAETGVIGTITFGMIHFTVLGMAWKARKYFSPTEPGFSLLSVGAALMMGKLAHGMTDHYWSRGSITPAWSAVGMALAGYYVARSRARLIAAEQAAEEKEASEANGGQSGGPTYADVRYPDVRYPGAVGDAAMYQGGVYPAGGQPRGPKPAGQPGAGGAYRGVIQPDGLNPGGPNPGGNPGGSTPGGINPRAPFGEGPR